MNSYSIAPITPMVKKLIIANFAIWFVLELIMGRFLGFTQWNLFTLIPLEVLNHFAVWQLFTYQFFHALSPFHIVFNMLMLWLVGSELEKIWSSRFFLVYYLLSGAGAALIYCLGVGVFSFVTGYKLVLTVPVLGASGSLFGLLIAYAIIFSDRVIYYMGLFPLKARHFVMLVAALDFISLLSTGIVGGEVAYLAHLGGLLSGFLILRGHAFLKKRSVSTKVKKKSSNLRLVVDNEKLKDDDKPKYWN